MYNTANCLLKYLNTKGENYFIGNKVHDDIVHNTNKKKKKYSSISIISSLSQDQLKNMFINSIANNDLSYVEINFGLYKFKIFSFRFIEDESLTDRKKHNIIMTSLDYVRNKKDFTINTLIMDENENILDYTYKYHNTTISSLSDINNKIIRVIGNPKKKFKESPIRILKALRLMSTLNYTIENQTLESIKKYLILLEKIDKNIIIHEFNKLLKGKNVKNTIYLMKEIGFFNLKINNINNYFNFILNDDILNSLEKLNEFKYISLIEIYSIIFLHNFENIDVCLKENKILDDKDINRIKWIITNYDMLENENIKLSIYNSLNDYIKQEKMKELKFLLNRLINIKILLKEPVSKQDTIFALCSRPYFYEQLKISDENIIKIYMEKYKNTNYDINDLKDKILYNLIIIDKYPKYKLNDFIKNIL